MSQARRLGKALSAVMAKYGLPATTSREELELAWKSAAGPRIAECTEVGSVRRGILEILVSDPILLQELEGFAKAEMLVRLKEKVFHTHLTGIKFRRR
jgi:hypothetical protein